ncbi:MAG: inositol monophosphatase family protein [Dehalococcoidia bacterium]
MTSPITLPVSASGAQALDVAWRCAREAAAIALPRFRGAQDVRSKGRGNVVTATDVDVEQRVRELLAAEFPSHGFLAEETAADTDPDRGFVWVLDPIDGTKNYAQGLPFWCINIALCLDGEPVVALTYDAVHGEGFHAEAGGGAFVNGVPVRASEREDVASSVLGMDLGYDDEAGSRQIALMERIFPNVQTIRILGSAALGVAYAASGRVDLFAHSNISPWDIAAGILVVREAGGAASDRSGAPLRLTSGTVVAGGRRVHDDFLARYAAGAHGGMAAGR